MKAKSRARCWRRGNVFYRGGRGYADLARAIRELGPVLGRRSKRARTLEIAWTVHIMTRPRAAKPAP